MMAETMAREEPTVRDMTGDSDKEDNFSLAQIGGNYVLAPKTALTWENCDELDTIFNGLAHSRKEGVILDFKSVPLMDSQILELLCRWQEALKRRGCLLKLTGLNQFCRHLLSVTRLLDVFRIYGDCLEAARN